ncbi:MAG: hypothetical protein JEZ09_17725 [Salinivirgaceae bacterium]|nr:hypothetical protein [Salinivirgaceae bacterium]
MITFSYNELLEILEVIYKGKVTYEELYDFGIAFENNKSLPRNLKMLTDVTKANYDFPPEKIADIAKNMENITKNYQQIKAAFIQTKPTETAMSILLQNEHRRENYIHKIFYSREQALEWLMGK